MIWIVWSNHVATFAGGFHVAYVPWVTQIADVEVLGGGGGGFVPVRPFPEDIPLQGVG